MIRGIETKIIEGVKSELENSENIVTRIEVDSELYNMNVIYQEILKDKKL